MPPHPAETAEAVPTDRLLGDLPADRAVDPDELAAAIAGGPRVVALDDDPTGSQTIADLPVLTTWSVDDLRWALRASDTGFFVLTNTRSLAPDDAAARNREVTAALRTAAAAEGVRCSLVSRSDSTLRGHFPLETDVLADSAARQGHPVDGVVLVPAFPDAGRITVDAVHWTRSAPGMVLPVGRTEFARDATFGFSSSDLRSWVAEKTGGRHAPEQVRAITLTDLRTGGADHVADVLAGLRDGEPAVVDAVHDEDLRVLALASLRAEARGSHLLYRAGPSFMRARTGQAKQPPLPTARLAELTGPGHGLVAIGSHVGLTTAQLAELRALGGIEEHELHVPSLLDDTVRDEHVRQVAERAAAAMADRDVVITTSRDLVTGAGADESLAIARAVSAGLVDAVRTAVRARRPAFVVAKGGITSSDVATGGLDIRRAVVRGQMLPGIISLWEPVSGQFSGVPYVVFPGNVGDAEALAHVVGNLRT
ncbi:four-carbon acid sugar kinase family protein [Salinifilum aidingensis]